MSPNEIIGEKVEGGWKPAPAMFAAWRKYPALQNLQPRMLFAGEDRRATPMFRGLWRTAMATTLSPVEPLVTEKGKPTQYFARLL